MAKNIIAMDSMKEGAVRVYNGMIVVYPWCSTEDVLDISELAPKFNGCYATNNSTVCFVTDGEIFVTPYTRLGISSLCSAGFRKEHFYVPFSNGDYPKAEQSKWNSLREKARQSYEADFVSDCEAYCDKRHIGPISEEALANCFEMPENGVWVKHPYFEDYYYPIIKSTCFDCTAASSIGRFCTNNGTLVFVYRDGKTYVTKDYKILEELRAAGYTKSNLFVPFSNGEQIQDGVLRERWESIAE